MRHHHFPQQERIHGIASPTEAILRGLSAKDPAVIEEALTKIEPQGDEGKIPELLTRLIKLLAHQNARVQIIAKYTLLQIGPTTPMLTILARSFAVMPSTAQETLLQLLQEWASVRNIARFSAFCLELGENGSLHVDSSTEEKFSITLLNSMSTIAQKKTEKHGDDRLDVEIRPPKISSAVIKNLSTLLNSPQVCIQKAALKALLCFEEQALTHETCERIGALFHRQPMLVLNAIPAQPALLYSPSIVVPLQQCLKSDSLPVQRAAMYALIGLAWNTRAVKIPGFKDLMQQLSSIETVDPDILSSVSLFFSSIHAPLRMTAVRLASNPDALESLLPFFHDDLTRLRTTILNILLQAPVDAELPSRLIEAITALIKDRDSLILTYLPRLLESQLDTLREVVLNACIDNYNQMTDREKISICVAVIAELPLNIPAKRLRRLLSTFFHDNKFLLHPTISEHMLLFLKKGNDDQKTIAINFINTSSASVKNFFFEQIAALLSLDADSRFSILRSLALLRAPQHTTLPPLLLKNLLTLLEAMDPGMHTRELTMAAISKLGTAALTPEIVAKIVGFTRSLHKALNKEPLPPTEKKRENRMLFYITCLSPFLQIRSFFDLFLTLLQPKEDPFQQGILKALVNYLTPAAQGYTLDHDTIVNTKLRILSAILSSTSSKQDFDILGALPRFFREGPEAVREIIVQILAQIPSKTTLPSFMLDAIKNALFESEPPLGVKNIVGFFSTQQPAIYEAAQKSIVVSLEKMSEADAMIIRSEVEKRLRQNPTFGKISLEAILKTVAESDRLSQHKPLQEVLVDVAMICPNHLSSPIDLLFRIIAPHIEAHLPRLLRETKNLALAQASVESAVKIIQDKNRETADPRAASASLFTPSRKKIRLQQVLDNIAHLKLSDGKGPLLLTKLMTDLATQPENIQKVVLRSLFTIIAPERSIIPNYHPEINAWLDAAPEPLLGLLLRELASLKGLCTIPNIWAQLSVWLNTPSHWNIKSEACKMFVRLAQDYVQEIQQHPDQTPQIPDTFIPGLCSLIEKKQRARLDRSYSSFEKEQEGRTIIQALGLLGPNIARPALERLLICNRLSLRGIAVAIIQEFSPSIATKDLTALLASELRYRTAEERTSIIKQLAPLGPAFQTASFKGSLLAPWPKGTVVERTPSPPPSRGRTPSPPGTYVSYDHWMARK